MIFNADVLQTLEKETAWLLLFYVYWLSLPITNPCQLGPLSSEGETKPKSYFFIQRLLLNSPTLKRARLIFIFKNYIKLKLLSGRLKWQMIWLWFLIWITDLTPYWSAFEFWKIEFKQSNRTSLIFSLFRNLILQATQTGKNQIWNRQKIKFVQLDFSNSIFQW